MHNLRERLALVDGIPWTNGEFYLQGGPAPEAVASIRYLLCPTLKSSDLTLCEPSQGILPLFGGQLDVFVLVRHQRKSGKTAISRTTICLISRCLSISAFIRSTCTNEANRSRDVDTRPIVQQVADDESAVDQADICFAPARRRSKTGRRSNNRIVNDHIRLTFHQLAGWLVGIWPGPAYPT